MTAFTYKGFNFNSSQSVKLSVAFYYPKINKYKIKVIENGRIRYITMDGDDVNDTLKNGKTLIISPKVIVKGQSIFNNMDGPKYSTAFVNSQGNPVYNPKQRDLKATKITYNFDLIPIVEKLLTSISEKLFTLANKHYQEYKIKFPQGFHFYIKLVYRSNYKNNEGWASKVIKVDNKLTSTFIYNKLYDLAERAHNTPDYTIKFNSIEMLITPLPVQGGCTDRNYKTYTIPINKKETIKIKSYKSKNNNCLFTVLNHFYEINGNDYKPDYIRMKLNIPLNEQIHYNEIKRIVDYYNEFTNNDYGYILVNENNAIIAIEQKEININIYLKDNHYFSYETKLYVKCKDCGLKYNMSKDHKCNIKSLCYKRNVLDQKNDIVHVANYKIDKIDYNQIVHFDLETFQEKNKHVVYACGYFLDGKYDYKYGVNCFSEVVDIFLQCENKIFSAYNGANFDFRFLISELNKKNIDINNIIYNNGRIMSFTFGNNNKVTDLNLYLNCKLKKACDDFKTDFCKGEFDHKKMKTVEDLNKHKDEVLDYLKLDVLALKELFEKFNDAVYEICEMNITCCVSAGALAYKFWASKLKHIIELPKDIKKYNFIKSATYGGRTYPQQKKFISKSYEKVISGEIKYKDFKRTFNFIFNADVSSLYPAAMKGTDYMKVFYPIGPSRWSDKPEEEFKKGLLGFYNIKFKVNNKKLRVPILPRAKYNVNNDGSKNKIGVEWSLLDGEGIYTSVDIQNAIDSGYYNIEFIDNCLVYDDKGDVFSEYIDLFYNKKKESEGKGNNAMRSFTKLMLNALYGKQLQKANFETTMIINNVAEFNKFVFEYELTEFDFLSEEKMIVKGINKNDVSCINKPPQLGAFVTAYSRRIMLHIMKLIDPTLKEMIFTYTDTDSLHISAESYFKLLDLGFIKDKKNAELGYLCNDIDNNGLIIKEKNLGPKSYMYEYITDDDKLHINECATMKYKGINKDILKPEYYENETPEPLTMNKNFKKVGTIINNPQKELDLTYFDVYYQEIKRTFNKNEWNGFTFKDNQFFPKGYEF